jgi:membrane dipeptidase
MAWIDAHLDLAYLALLGRDLRRPCPDARTGCISLPALRDAGIDLVFATIFTEPHEPGRGADEPHRYPSSADREACFEAGRRQVDVYDQLHAAGEISIVRSAGDLAGTAPRPRVVLLMEGADPIRRPEEAGWWFDRGVRIVGQTWAAGSRYAGGNAAPGPLTAAGRELVASLDELGIIHDASHLADAAFDDLMQVARGPVIASHSNCRALLGESQRHLRDDQIRAIASRGRGGVIGLNLYRRFLVPAGENRRATMADCVRHLGHAAAVMGHRRGIGLGSDMDGGFVPSELPEELDRPAKVTALAAGLREAGWTEEDVRGFEYGNWHRFLERSLPRG